jgi:hypothetical protein
MLQDLHKLVYLHYKYMNSVFPPYILQPNIGCFPNPK